MKRILVLVLAFVLLFSLAGCGGSDEQPTKEPELDSAEAEALAGKESPMEAEALQNEEPADLESEEPGITWDDLKDQDSIIGKSDKDYLEITKSKPTSVRNDTTGKWKKSITYIRMEI